MAINAGNIKTIVSYFQDNLPDKLNKGYIWYNSYTKELLFKDYNENLVKYNNYIPHGDRGIITELTGIYYVTISTPGSAQNFGNLLDLSNSYFRTSCSNGGNDRGIVAGGYNYSSGTKDSIEYITISTPGNSKLFGNISSGISGLSSCSNNINNRGVFMGGGYINRIEYITISIPGSAQNFGNLLASRASNGGTSNSINDRGIVAGGQLYTNNTYINTKSIEYITISTPGNSLNFGDSLAYRYSGCSNGINDRAVFGGGGIYDSNNSIDYITISTLSNAHDFGDLISGGIMSTSWSNGINDRASILMRSNSNIEYFNISNKSNSLVFGSISSSDTVESCSNSF